MKQINCYPQSLSPLSHGIDNWEKNADEISMLGAPLNRLWLYCVAATIQVFHKRLRKLVNFSGMTGRKLFRDVDAKRVCIQFLRCILDTRRRASILNEAISWIEGNAIFDDVCMSMLLRFSRTFRIRESFRSHDDFIYSIPRFLIHSRYISPLVLKFHDFELMTYEKVSRIRYKIFCGKLT